MAKSRLMLVAHRGRAGDAPENAIESLSGLPPWIDGVEVDVRITADGALVLMHDAEVGRTTDGNGRIDELTANRLERLRLAGGATIPHLADYLQAVARSEIDVVLVDVKVPEVSAIEQVINTIRASRITDRCVTLCRTREQLMGARERGSDLRLGVLGVTLASVDDWAMVFGELEVETAFLAPGDDAYRHHRTVVPRLLASGVRVGGSILNAPDTLDLAASDGCTTIVTDRSLELRDWKARRAS